MTYTAFQRLNYSWMALGAIVFLVLLRITAPYGRYSSPKWGPQIKNNLGWIFMEVPAMFLVVYFMCRDIQRQSLFALTLAAFFVFHYVNRTFIFPFRIRTKGKKMPVVIVASGFMFNILNGFLIGYYFWKFGEYSNKEFIGPRFIAGLLVFVSGIIINWNYDNKLIHLRRPGETNYQIPEGKLFNYISCPNLLGEVIEWTGFAIMCWNLAAASFLVWTVANLIPRAVSHHKWYRQHFPGYPEERKAILPFIL